jgi:hypothetical protein
MTVIEIPDDKAAVLKARAAAEGLTLKAWLGKLAAEAPSAERKLLKTGRGMVAPRPPRQLLRIGATLRGRWELH